MARIELIDDDTPPPSIRRPRPHATERRNVVGGSMVSNMKRGMKREQPWRTGVLAAIALVLLIALNWTWIARLHTRAQAAGGWGVVAANAREWATGGLAAAGEGMKETAGAAARAGKLFHEEM